MLILNHQNFSLQYDSPSAQAYLCFLFSLRDVQGSTGLIDVFCLRIDPGYESLLIFPPATTEVD